MKMSIILAAGQGTRMKSEIPKTLHKVCGKEMIKYVIEASIDSGIDKNIVVLGHGKEKVGYNIKDMDVQTVEQPMGDDLPYGTGYAVMAAEKFIDKDDMVLILCADGPLISKETLVTFMAYHMENNHAASAFVIEFIVIVFVNLSFNCSVGSHYPHNRIPSILVIGILGCLFRHIDKWNLDILLYVVYKVVGGVAGHY
jgi:UTP-glucose-1-phosphate uridylyltransferase